MNAILRDDCEAIVLTNEAIEVHLSYLRPAVEALGDKLDQLNTKIDNGLAAVNEKLDNKLDELNRKIDNGLGAVNKKLDDKLDAVTQKIDQNDKEHIERTSKIQASLEGLKWFVSSATVLASGASIAHSLGWI